jgi:SH3 domain protein
LQRKNESLSEQARAFQEENEAVKTENQVLKTELEASKKALEELTRNYETLKSESAEFIDFKEGQKDATTRVNELSLKAETLEKENSRLKTRQSIRWFVAGAGVLFVGYLIGMIGRRNRRRSSLLS